VASELGQGSTFAFYVKSRRAEDHVSRVENTPSQAASSRSMSHMTSIKGSTVTEGKLHILLVEDNIVNQQVVEKQLTKAGCVVMVANHGIEALEVLRSSDLWHEKTESSKHLDIILMDWEMPIMDGLACSREIRALQKSGKITRHIEIIATTANARDEQIKTALSSGCVSIKNLTQFSYVLC
jgi:CheY-like chemotaxis protein